MKKAYKKPDILFESFTIGTSIAGDCANKTELQSRNVCGLDFGGEIIFTNSITGCTIKVEDGDLPAICYHAPTDTSRLFGS